VVRRRKDVERKIALERIEILFKQAEKQAMQHNLSRASRYVELARKIGMKYNIPFPRSLKRRFCKHCLSYLLPAANCRIRMNRGKVTVTCENCGKITRIPYLREKN